MHTPCALPVAVAVFVVLALALIYLPISNGTLAGILMMAALLLLPTIIVQSIREVHCE